MVTDLTQLSGQQIELPIIHFADILSHKEIWNLQTRYYDPDMDHTAKEYHPIYGGVAKRPNMIRLYKELQKLKEVNEHFEYMLWISDVNDEDERAYGLTFSKQGQMVLIDIH